MAQRQNEETSLKVRIERMKEEDLDQVMAIERASYSDPWSYSAFERELSNIFSRPMVALLGERVVGYVIYWIAGPEFHILNIAVHQDYRRRGIGRLLMNHVVGEALREKAEFIALEVRPSNVAAKSLYRSYGFVVVGRRPQYYTDGEDAEVMILRLRN